MAKKENKEIIRSGAENHLIDTLKTVGFRGRTTPDQLELYVEAGAILDADGYPIERDKNKTAYEKVIDQMAEGKPIYILAEDTLNRVYINKEAAGMEQVRYDDNPPVPPRRPGFFSQLMDKVLRAFGSSWGTCDRWNEYEKAQEMRSVYQAVMIENRKVGNSPVSVRESAAGAFRGVNYDVDMKGLNVHAFTQDTLVCGDPKALEYMMNEEHRTPVEKAVLGFRKDTANKIEALERNAQRPVCPEIRKDGADIYLPGARQPAKQSTTNGCWSVSMASLLAYHGVNLTQQEIRAYRPDCSFDAKRKMPMKTQIDERKRLCNRMNNNEINDISDYSDLIHTTMQDVALHHVGPNVSRGTDELKHYIRMGLEEHKSPISMCVNNHFRTVVGIEGDTLLLLDPQKKYPEVDGKIKPTRVELSSLYFGGYGVSLDWIEKLDDKTKEAAINSIKGVESGETFSRRKGFTKEIYDEVFPGDSAITEHHIVYPKAYEQEALRRVKEDADKVKAPEQIKENKNAPERQSSEPGLSRKEAEIKFREVKKAFLETKNEIKKDEQARQAKQNTKKLTKEGVEAFEVLAKSTKANQNTGATTAPKTVPEPKLEKDQESTRQSTVHKSRPKAKENGMIK